HHIHPRLQLRLRRRLDHPQMQPAREHLTTAHHHHPRVLLGRIPQRRHQPPALTRRYPPLIEIEPHHPHTPPPAPRPPPLPPPLPTPPPDPSPRSQPASRAHSSRPPRTTAAGNHAAPGSSSRSCPTHTVPSPVFPSTGPSCRPAPVPAAPSGPPGPGKTSNP